MEQQLFQEHSDVARLLSLKLFPSFRTAILLFMLDVANVVTRYVDKALYLICS